MADLVTEIEEAIIDALAGITAPAAAGGAAIPVPTYDFTPENAALPFIVLAGNTTEPDDAYDAPAVGCAVTFEVWSQYRGRLQVNAIVDAIADRLHNVGFALASGQINSCRVTRRIVSRDPDVITRQGIVTVEVRAAKEDI